MRNENHNHANPLPTIDELVERELEVALAKYAAVDPRVGLEERVLANLRAERAHRTQPAWWRWGLTAAALAVIVAAVGLAWKTGRTSPPVSKHPSNTEQPRQPSPQVVANGAGGAGLQVPKPARKANRPRISPPVEAVSTNAPRLDQFPSPRPLSEQERILAGYVAKYPERAALLAEARMEALRRDAEERVQLAAQDQNSQQ